MPCHVALHVSHDGRGTKLVRFPVLRPLTLKCEMLWLL